jgi:hypothetical protein
MLSFCSAWPERVLVPTAQTKAVPLPDAINVFANKKGDGLY